jgi:magnesium transporter
LKGVSAMAKGSDWKWIRVDTIENNQVFTDRFSKKILHQNWFAKNGAQSDHFTLSDQDKDGTVLIIGSLPIVIENYHHEKFYFIFNKDELVTSGITSSLFEWLSNNQLESSSIESQQSSMEGLLTLVNEVLDHFSINLYPTFKHIKMLHKEIERDKTSEHLSQLIDYRHKLIRWENLLLPYEEFLLTLKAAFGDSITDLKFYQLTQARVEKIFKLIDHYNGTLTKLLDLDNTLVEYRGNEIMKTLTVFTVIATPVTALGALWGMNFKHMPELNEKFGYPAALLVIVLASAFIYSWMHKKGWTQNILKGKKGRDRKD